MTGYPTSKDKAKAIKEQKIYCRQILRCPDNYYDHCCYFCKEQPECHIRCCREYWTVCKERVGWKEMIWKKVFGDEE